MADWYTISNPGCPSDGSDAGDATEWMKQRSLRRVQAARRSARREFDEAKRWLHMNRAKSEEHARLALRLGAEAYWFAELTELAEREHRTLHAMGRWTVSNFDCWLTFEDGQYTNSCPVSIADVRLGFSPGFVGRGRRLARTVRAGVDFALGGATAPGTRIGVLPVAVPTLKAKAAVPAATTAKTNFTFGGPPMNCSPRIARAHDFFAVLPDDNLILDETCTRPSRIRCAQRATNDP